MTDLSLRDRPLGPRGVVVTAVSGAPPAATWALVADPSQWARWAPHIRRVEVLDGGPPDSLARGQRVRISSLGPVAVRARITRVDPGVRWDFVVPLLLGARLVNAHVVEPMPGGSRILVQLVLDGSAPVRVVAPALAAYQPLAGFALRRLARLAELDDPRGSG